MIWKHFFEKSHFFVASASYVLVAQPNGRLLVTANAPHDETTGIP